MASLSTSILRFTRCLRGFNPLVVEARRQPINVAAIGPCWNHRFNPLVVEARRQPGGWIDQPTNENSLFQSSRGRGTSSAPVAGRQQPGRSGKFQSSRGRGTSSADEVRRKWYAYWSFNPLVVEARRQPRW